MTSIFNRVFYYDCEHELSYLFLCQDRVHIVCLTYKFIDIYVDYKITL